MARSHAAWNQLYVMSCLLKLRNTVMRCSLNGSCYFVRVKKKKNLSGRAAATENTCCKMLDE